jgi:hypothetical protein
MSHAWGAWARANYIISNPQNTRAWLVYGKEASAKLTLDVLYSAQVPGVVLPQRNRCRAWRALPFHSIASSKWPR